MEQEKISVLILEDDPFFKTSLGYLLKESNFVILDFCDNTLTFEKYFENANVDIIICNLTIGGINLKKDWLNKFISQNVPIIGITAISEDTQFNDLKDVLNGFLVKPFHKHTLLFTLLKAIEQTENIKLYDFVGDKYLLIRKQGNVLQRYNYSEILYLESAGNYCYIHTKNKKLIEKISLNKILREKLDHRFKRVHHKYAINSAYLQSVGSSSLRLYNDTEIPVSKTFRSNLKGILANKRA